MINIYCVELILLEKQKKKKKQQQQQQQQILEKLIGLELDVLNGNHKW